MTSNGVATAAGNSRVNFGKIKLANQYPDLLEIQIKSFQEFFQLETTPENRGNEGLYRVFQENFPISDARNIFVLEFLDYFIDPPRYTIEECMQRGLTYSVPLKAKLRLSCNDEEHVDFQTIVQDVFLGNIPYMTNSDGHTILDFTQGPKNRLELKELSVEEIRLALNNKAGRKLTPGYFIKGIC